MRTSITYLDSLTIVIFPNGRITIVDENLEGWKNKTLLYPHLVRFLNGTRMLSLSDYGTKEWRHKGCLHRADGPAFIAASGTKEWWQQGELHRDDGPAVVHPDGSKEWYQHGVQIQNPNELHSNIS